MLVIEWEEGTGVWGAPRAFGALDGPDQPHLGLPLGSLFRHSPEVLIWFEFC